MFYPEHIQAFEDLLSSLSENISLLDAFLNAEEDNQNSKDWTRTRTKLDEALNKTHECQSIDGTSYRIMLSTPAFDIGGNVDAPYVAPLERIICSLLRNGDLVFEMKGAEIKKYYQLGILDLVPEDILIQLVNDTVSIFAPIIKETKAIISSQLERTPDGHYEGGIDEPTADIYIPSIENVHELYAYDETYSESDESAEYDRFVAEHGDPADTVAQLEKAQEAFKSAIIDWDAVTKYEKSFSVRYVNDTYKQFAKAKSSLKAALTNYYIEHSQPFNLLLKRETGSWGYKGVGSLEDYIVEGAEEGLQRTYLDYIERLKDFLDKNPHLKKGNL